MESIDRRGFGRSSGPRGAAASMRKPDIMREKFPKKKHLKPATFWRMIREAIDRNSGNSVSKRELLAAGFERDVALEYVRQGCYDMEILEHQEAVNWLWVCFWALFHSKSKNVFEDLVWEQERGDITFSLRPKGASSEHQVIKASSQIEKYGEKTEEEEMYSPLLNDRQPKIPVGAISEKQIEAQPMGHGAVEPEERDIVSQDEGDGGSQPAADRRAGPLHAALATDGAVPAPPTHAGFATFEDDRGRGMGGSATIVNEAVKTIVQELRERHLPYITVGLVRRDPTLCEKFTELYRQWKGDPAVSSERAIKNIFSALSSSRGGAYDGECLKAERVMGELRYSLPDPTLGLPQASEAEPEKDLFKLLKNRELVKGGVVDLGGSTWFVTGPLTVDYPLVLKNGTICGLRQINAGPSLVITNVTLCWRESHFKTRMESFEVEGSEKGVTGAEVKTTTWKQRTGHSAAADGANLAHGGAALQTPPSQVLIGQKRLAPGSCDSHGADGAAERPSRQRRCSDTGGAVGQDAADKDLCGQLALDWPTRGNAFHRSFMLPIGGPPVDLGHQILACWDMASSSQGRHALTLVIEASAAPDPGQALKVLSRLASVVSGDAPALRAVADIAHRQANAGLSRVSQSLADSKASIDTAAAVEAVGRYAAIRRAVDLAGVLEATARALDACEGVAALAKMVLEEGRLVLAKRWRGGQGREEGLDGSVQA